VSVDVVLVTGQDMPIEDVEGPQIVSRLRDRRVSAEVRQCGGDDWSDVGLAVIRSTWDYTARHRDFLAWLHAAGAATRVVNPPAVIEWNSHKKYLLELSDGGVPVVPTLLVRAGATIEEQRDALAASGDRVVVKPAVSVGALGAMRARADDQQLVEHLAEICRQGDVLVQPYVESIATSGESSLLFFDGELSHAVRKLPGAGDYRIHEHLGGSTQPLEPSDAEIAAASRALAQVDVSGPLTYARVDLVQLADGPAIMELELIEPYLFLEYAPGSVDQFADALVAELT
jgi:glutathione synthase/RimK-type ligase-like ATP-grasp enzyme